MNNQCTMIIVTSTTNSQ